MNVSSACMAPTPEEKEALAELEKQFFRYLNVSHWENLEVTDYWKKMAEKGSKQNLDI